MLGLGSSLAKGGASLLTYVKDNLKLYLDFKSNKSDTLKFPCEGSTYFVNDDYIDIGDDTSLDITGNITLSCWVKPTVVGVTRTIFGRDDSTNRNYFFMCNTSNQFNFSCFGLTDTTVLSSTTFSVGNWYHLMGTYDGARLKLYINGVLETNEASTGTINNTDVSFAIGAREAGMDRHWDGYIANVGLWSRALSAEEVNSVMRKNYSQLGSVEKTSLVMWQSLDSRSTTGGAKEVVTPSSGEVLGDELVDNLNGTTSGWDAMSGNALSVNTYDHGTYVVCIYNQSEGDNVNAMRFFLGSSGTGSALSENVEVGALYKISMTGYIGGTTTSYPVSSDSGVRAEGSSWGANAENVSTKTFYYKATNASGNIIYPFYELGSYTTEGMAFIKDVSVKKVLSISGQITGATTTTSVYGGNAPVLPRAVDVAREGEAEAIGDGSASFDGTDDRIDIGNFTNLNAVSSFTITAWMKRLESNDAVTIEKSADGNNRTGINLYTDGSVYVNIGEGGSAYGGVALAGTDWNHVAVVFDGSLSGNANRAKIYTNGILQTLSFTGTIPSATDSNTDSLYFGYDPVNDVDSTGNISQVGIWRGALTQAQIQSVMESTSYDKIPASVKSTLTEKVTNGDFSSTSGWTEGTGWDINTTTGVASADGTAGFNYLAQSSIFNSNLHKMTITIDSCSNLNNAGIIKNGSVVNFNTGLGISSVGTHTIYFTNSTANLSIYSNGETTTISNISIEEVTNDLVGYWALDSTENNLSVKNVTPNSLGENLGDEEFRGSYAPKPYLGSDWEITGGSASVNEDSSTRYVTFITTVAEFSSENQHRGGKIEFTSSNSGMLTGGAVANQIYKIVVSGYMSETNGQSVASYPSLYAGAYQYETADVWTTEETTKTYYFTASHVNNDTFYPSYNMKAGQQFTLTGISVKKVNGNYGSLN